VAGPDGAGAVMEGGGMTGRPAGATPTGAVVGAWAGTYVLFEPGCCGPLGGGSCESGVPLGNGCIEGAGM
jgi:hypothetical protein